MAFVQNGHITLHYQWLNPGRDQTIILINSLGSALSIWDEVVPRISPAFNVLRFDKRGHGLSSTEPGVGSIGQYADDVIFLMDHLGIPKAHLLGLSIGGQITMSLASRYPERFEKLIFSNTGAKLGTTESWNARIESIRELGLEAMADTIIQRWMSQAYRHSHPAETAGYTNMVARNTEIGYIQACEALRDADFRQLLADIPHPCLFMGGSEDQGTTPEFVQKNARNMDAERIEIIAGVGHIPSIEAPDQVAELILDFLSESSTETLYERGMKVRRSVLGDAHVDRAEATKTAFDEDFQTYIVNSAWGSIWARPHLSKRDRSLITIALLAALGHEEELAMHLRATRNTGASASEVKEALLHTGIYAGVPVTNGAMKLAKQIFNQEEYE